MYQGEGGAGFQEPQELPASGKSAANELAPAGRRGENRSQQAPCNTTREASDTRHSTMEWRFTFGAEPSPRSLVRGAWSLDSPLLPAHTVKSSIKFADQSG